MRIMLYACAAAAFCLAPEAQGQTAVPAMAASPQGFRYLDPAEFVPSRLLPPPPERGSVREAQEIAELRRLIASASPERLSQAKWDGDHEDPTAFNAVMGRDLKAMPATWGLLTLVQDEAEAAEVVGKGYFKRMRPCAAVPGLPHCVAVKPDKDPFRSYPSGHTTLGYAIAHVLARLVPEKAPAILARAADYGLSREYAGRHFPSDIEAGHVLGTLVAVQLLADPRLADRIASARAELATR